MEEDGDGVTPAQQQQQQQVDDDASQIQTISPSEEARLDLELKLVRKMRLAFAATLSLLEAARDDLAEQRHRAERLTAASQQCRSAQAETNKLLQADMAFDKRNNRQWQEKANSNSVLLSNRKGDATKR